MNPWVERALWSVAASAVSTAMWVTTAKNPGASKRRRRRATKKGKGGKQSSDADHSPVPRSPGAQAVRDHENGQREGLSASEFLDNLQQAGARNAARMVRLRNWLKEGGAPPPPPQAPSAKARAAPKTKSEPTSSSPLDEAKKAARKEFRKQVASRSGITQASEKWHAASASLKDAGEKIGDSFKRNLPENWTQGMGAAGRNIKDAIQQAGQNVREGFEDEQELGEKLDRGMRDLGRWIQGPGAPKEQQSPIGTSEESEGDWVEARIPDELGPPSRKPSTSGDAARVGAQEGTRDTPAAGEQEKPKA